jgi:MFS superfamily sulfate permease-like transporter
VKTVGQVPAGLPPIRVPHFSPGLVPQLFAQAAGLALVCFSSMMITSRSFASKNRYDVDADREFAALGAANIAAALSQGFAVSGADSRTAMSDASGGRTQVTGLVAAATIAAVLLFFTAPLQYVPVAALGAVLVKAALSLVGVAELREIYRIDRREFGLSLVATLGVVAVGAIDAILVAIALALVRFVRLVSRPKVEVLGETPDLPGFHSLARHADAKAPQGLLLFRFNGPLVFFNAPYWKRALLAAADAAGPELRWVVIDMLPVTLFDATGVYTAREVFETLRARGLVVATAARKTELARWFAKRGLTPTDLHAYATLREALRAYARASGTPDRQVEQVEALVSDTASDAVRGASPS